MLYFWKKNFQFKLNPKKERKKVTVFLNSGLFILSYSELKRKFPNRPAYTSIRISFKYFSLNSKSVGYCLNEKKNLKFFFFKKKKKKKKKKEIVIC